MTDRARLSKLSTYTTTQGATFLGSVDFPPALIKALSKYDPKSLLFSTSEINSTPDVPSQSQYRSILDRTIRNKRILVCSGADDKLVPYHCSEPFLQFLKNATGPGGWYKEGNVYLEDIVYPGVGHAFSDGMLKDTVRFVNEALAGKTGQSKM